MRSRSPLDSLHGNICQLGWYWLIFNLDAVRVSQQECASATHDATVKPLVAEVCILTLSLNLYTSVKSVQMVS